MVYKLHPIAIVDGIRALFIIVVVPTTTRIINCIPRQKTTAGHLFLVVTIVSAIMLRYARLNSILIEIADGKIIVKQDFWLKSHREIPFTSVQSVAIIERPILKLFSASLICINTVVAEKRRSELKFAMRTRDAKQIAEAIFKRETPDDDEWKNVKVSLVAAISSSAIVGFFTGLPVIGKIAAIFCKVFVSRTEKSRVSLKEIVVAGGTHWLTYKQIYCKKQKLCEIKTLQNPFDIKRGTSSLKLTVSAGKNKKVKIRRLKTEDAISSVREYL